MTRRRHVRGAFGLATAVALVLIAAAPASAALLEYFPLPSALRNADRIAPGPDGALWFAQEEFQRRTNALGRITTDGAASVVAIPSGSSPVEVTAGPDSALWYVGVGRRGGGRLGQVTAAGVNEIALPQTDTAIGIVTGPDRALWFTASERIGRHVPGGALTFFAVPGARIMERIVAAPDALWFSERGVIGRITTSGVVRVFTLPGALDAQDIALGADGALWFTPSFEGRIGRMSPSGRVRTYALPDPTDHPRAITAGPDGAMWFTDSFSIGRITPTGEVTKIPVPDRRGFFSFSRAITAGPDGRIWFTQQEDDDNDINNGSSSAQIGRIDLPRIGKQLLVTRLADRPLRGRGNHLLRIEFTATRKASGVLRLLRNGRTVTFRRVRAGAGTNSVAVRLPRRPGTYRLLLTLALPTQSASDSGLVTVRR